MEEYYKGYKVRIEQDTLSDSPCTWDNFGLIVLQKKVGIDKKMVNQIIPDDFTEYDTIENKEGELEDLEVHYNIEEYLSKVYDATLVIPIRFMDFGSNGCEVRICDMDEANGAIYTTKKQITKLTDKEPDAETLTKYLKEELKMFNQWLEGDVWEYYVEDEDGEFMDSCMGFFGIEECKKEAYGVIDHHIDEIADMPVFEVVVTSKYRINAKDADAACDIIADRVEKDRYQVEGSLEMSATEIIHGEKSP